MTTACIVGSTGLVGREIFTTLLARPEVKGLHAFSRKDLSGSEKLKIIQSQDSDAWPNQYPTGAEIFFSGLGATRTSGGGFAGQYKIDHDLNLELAKAAKAAGTKVYVLISSAGANSASSFGYMKMKGQLEDDVKALDFDHCVVVRPGLLCGDREDSQGRLFESVFKRVANAAGAISGNRLKDSWAQNVDVIGKAAVRAGFDCLEGKEEAKFKILDQADIVRLGRTEWKD